jgi:hypothetical protein
MPRISIVVPSYNHERFVGAAVASALAQTFTDIEVIAVDDASTDGSAAVLDAIRDPRFRYVVHPQNRGCSATLNTGIRLATGEYLAVLDSDDLFLPHKLARQLEVLEANPTLGAVFSLCEVIDESGSSVPDDSMARKAAEMNQANRPRHAWLARFFDDGNCLCHPTSVMRTALFDELGLYDERLAQLQDFDMWLRLLRRYEIFIVQEKLACYRWARAGTNLSAARSPGRLSRVAWEVTQVLRHYLGLSVEDLEAIFGAAAVAPYRQHDVPPDLMVADIAAQRPSITFHTFALNLLFEALPPYGRTSPWHNRLMELAEKLDPMGTQTIMHLQRELEAQAKRAAAAPGMSFTYRHQP